MFGKHKNKTTDLRIPSRIIAVWGAGGTGTARLSFDLCRELAASGRVILAELPCFGIPRLGFLTGMKDRDKHIEGALLELEKKGELCGDYCYHAGKNLALLAANIYAVPDYPVTIRAELETLIAFPAAFVRYARSLDYPVIVFECQGQLATPMTFFALKLADNVIIPVSEAGELAFSLLNIRRLVHVFHFSPLKFRIVTKEQPALIEQLLKIKDEEGKDLEGVTVGEAGISELLKYLSEPSDSGVHSQWQIHDEPVDDSQGTIRL